MLKIICLILLLVIVTYLFYGWYQKTRYRYLIRNEHEIIVKQICKKGKLHKLIDNCRSIVYDYESWESNNDLNVFYQKELILEKYKKEYMLSKRILSLLAIPRKLEYYNKLNKKYTPKEHAN